MFDFAGISIRYPENSEIPGLSSFCKINFYSLDKASMFTWIDWFNL